MNLFDYLSQERGRQAALAKVIGAHAPDLSRWANGSRPIPIEYGAPIEKGTNGAVTRKEMFPDTWQKIWPELADDITPVAHHEPLPCNLPDDANVRESKGPVGRLPPHADREMT